MLGFLHRCPPSSAPACAMLLALTAAPGAAQGFLGRVMDGDADTAVAGAAVTLVDSAGTRLVTASTDTAGAFGLPVYTPGTSIRCACGTWRTGKWRPGPWISDGATCSTSISGSRGWPSAWILSR